MGDKKKRFFGSKNDEKENAARQPEMTPEELEQEHIRAELEPKIRKWMEKHFDLLMEFKNVQTKASSTGFSMPFEKVIGRFTEKVDYDTYVETLPKGMESRLKSAHEEFFCIPNAYEQNVTHMVERICREIVKSRQHETKHELKTEAKKKETVVISLDPKIRKKLGIGEKELED